MNESSTSRVASSTLLICIFCMFALSGCRKDGPPQWDVDLLGPLAHASLGIDDLVADSLIQVDGNQNVTLLFTSRLFGLSLDTVLNLPDTSFFYRYGLPFPGPVTLQPNTPFFSQNNLARFDLQDVELQEMEVRTGELLIDVTSMVPGETVANFVLPGASFNNLPVTLNSAIPPGTPSSPTITSLVRDLAGHDFDLRGPMFNDVNTLTTEFGFATADNGNTVTINDQDSLIAELNYNDIVPQYARGYFGMRTVEIGPESTEFNGLNNIISGSIDLDQVTVRLKVENGIGVDMQAYLNQIRGVNTSTGNTVDLQHAITSGPVNITRATDLNNGFTPSLYTTELNNSNSNADVFLENLPDRLELAADLFVNPLGDISNGHDFLYYESELIADLEVELPLCLIATDLTLQNNLALNLPGTANAHAFQYGTLTLYITNGFPLDALLTVNVVDENGAFVQSLANAANVPSGVVDSNNEVIAGTDSELVMTLSAAGVDQLYANSQLVITAVFNTASQTDHVKIKDHYTMDLQLVADFNYVVNGDE